MTRDDPRAPVLDLLGVGCGPFNLGLMALASTIDDLTVKAVDSVAELRWHPGLMFEDALLQVGFLADLVSLVAPTHPLSFLAYLSDVDRMYPFYIREQFHMTREEYEDYLRWAAAQLESIEFDQRVERIEWSDERRCYEAEVTTREGTVAIHARNLALGIGTEPSVPPIIAAMDRSRWLHSGRYLEVLDRVDAASRVTVVGSGQSGAEIVIDLLRRRPGPDPGVSWLTRTSSFAPLDYSKLVLEMTTPEYVTYFHELPEPTRDELITQQWRHYKGISTETLDVIHDLLYRRAVRFGHPGVELRPDMEVRGAREAARGIVLECRHAPTGAKVLHETDLVIGATGYRHRKPRFLEPLLPELERDGRGRLALDLDHAVKTSSRLQGQIFVANADLHTHGVAAPDLGIGAYRNARILNAVTGREVYRLPRRTAFSCFDPAGRPRGRGPLDEHTA